MLGMYPPEGSYTEVVELNTVDLTYDYITANPTYVTCKQCATAIFL